MDKKVLNHDPTHHDNDSDVEHNEDPQCLPVWRKWMIVVTISTSSLCVACASSLSALAEVGVSVEFHVEHTVSVLSISLFAAGLALGPLIIGPLSEFYGRRPIYCISYGLFFALSWPVAFAPNIGIFLMFRFITGFCGSAFLSVAGGSVSDLFSDSRVANPMAFYTGGPFLGPVLGPLLSGFINQHLNWRWTYYLVIIWSFVQLLAIILFVPETYAPILNAKAQRSVNSAAGSLYTRSQMVSHRCHHTELMESAKKGVLKAIFISCYTPLKLLLFDRMALLLDLWSSLTVGILYLAFQVYPIIFQEGHGFNLQETGLGFLGIGVGIVLGISTQPYWNRFYEKISRENGGVVPPEARLRIGQVGGICVPVGLFSLAFTTYPRVHWIAPIVASIPFGGGMYFVFASTFTYLVTTYRPIAASAMAANGAMRSTFAAVFSLFAAKMYAKLGTVGATALLAGLTTVLAPLPFIFAHIGPRLRRQSRFAA
ncbi:MFS general substrate transporter [Macrolepiota fuliginosa MF-IS2]|uniref:MFS general substrate transporter n=1 Tax=Macrolepiota fuliginosa MF-IS2 TaxID=1400762 RepID=A0A9P5XAR4_9AGAR|nr:MFS general substrate transporter [Macrolepiota fuliginosa MF-IS2]